MPRVYTRKFDHEEAKCLYKEGRTITDIARHMGVTWHAVARIVARRYRETRERAQAAYRERHTAPCEGCGKSCLATTHASRRVLDGRALCVRCRADEKTERLRFDDDGNLVAVRCRSADCANGERWQPPSHFTRGTGSGHIREGGIHGQCRACQNRARREYRHAHPEKERERDRRYRAARRAAGLS
jgi:hypothetical protein